MKLFGWKPPQRPEWIKVIMRTPVPIRVQLVLLTVLTVSSFTSTILQLTRKETRLPVDSKISSFLELKKPGAKLILKEYDGTEKLVELYKQYQDKSD